MATVTANIGFMNKIASLQEVKKLIVNTPRDMAFKVAGELKNHELNFGNPSEIGVVASKIGRVSGNLARSFDAVEINDHTWAVQQTQSIAPYAEKMARYSMWKFQIDYMDSVSYRLEQFLLTEAIDEFEYAMKLIAADRPFTYHPPYGDSGISTPITAGPPKPKYVKGTKKTPKARKENKGESAYSRNKNK